MRPFLEKQCLTFLNAGSRCTSLIPTNEGSKFKLDFVEFRNSYILMINIINVNLRLINFVYFFETPGTTEKLRLICGVISVLNWVTFIL